ncbi:MAG: hypothetical protein OEV30_08365 [Ignavibacteria bacterium]|nr:hypothetical protein [Ignavibacteria bacterium]
MAGAQLKKEISDRELEEMKEVISNADESFGDYLEKFKFFSKLKLSAYLQPQFRVANLEGTTASTSGGSFDSNVNKAFELRRGRIKMQYEDMLTKFVFQIDGRQSGIIVKDAYGAITDPWVRAFGFQIGIYDRPFGFENAFSSGSRETPERARVVQITLPGERELGAKVFYAPKSGALSFLRVDAAVVNGAGPLSGEFDNYKDFIGRAAVRVPLGDGDTELDAGVSGYLGNIRNNTKYLWTMGAPSQGFMVDSSASNIDSGVPRQYYGADAQFYADLLGLGGTALRAEIIGGTQPGGSSAATPGDAFGTSLTTVSPLAQPTGPIYRRNFTGWYVNVVQNIGKDHQFLFKYDVYDPNTDISGSQITGSNNLSPADIKYSTVGAGYTYHWNRYVKFVLYYEWITNETVSGSAVSNPALAPFVNDLNDNIFTFRTQIKI